MVIISAVAAALSAAAPSSETSWPSVATPIGAQGGGDADVAVVVGISDYLVLPDVAGAADNARDWAQHLMRVRRIPRGQVTLLVDGEATRERIERALGDASKRVRSSGRVWFVFVGHGAPSPDGDDGLLLGADAQPDTDSLAARGILQRRVEAIIDAGAHRDAVVIYDACFSGRAPDGGVPLVPNLQATLPVRRDAGDQKRSVVLSSSESFSGPLPGESRPAFSYLLLGAARGWASDVDGDGLVSVDEAMAFSNDTIASTVKLGGRQPKRRGRADRVVLATKRSEAAPDVSALVLGRCPEGQVWKQRSCVEAACPPGATWNGASCAASVASVSCPPGAAWNGTACVADVVVCPAGATWQNGTCVALGDGLPSPTTVKAWNMPECFHPVGHEWRTHCTGTPVSIIDGDDKTAWAPAILYASALIEYAADVQGPYTVRFVVSGDSHSDDPACMVHLATSSDGRSFKTVHEEAYVSKTRGIGTFKGHTPFRFLRIQVGDHGDADVRDGYACGWVAINEVSLSRQGKTAAPSAR